ncbi:MAG: GNAT family N-acetyltransferase [Flavobacteriaceae bacterium]
MKIVVADISHIRFAKDICKTIEASATQRGTGIARRTEEYIITKLENNNAVVAFEDEKFAGFCYIERWDHGKYIAHSGLIVHPDFRNLGLAKKIKKKIFNYSLEKYPDAKIFGITTGLAVMKINSDLGYKPVPFSELTDDAHFWAGCNTCTNYKILKMKEHKMCLCTGMLYVPKKKKNIELEETQIHEHPYDKKVWTRLKNIKQALFLKNKKK